MARHQDSFADETPYSKQERVDEFQTFNPDATDDVSISHPSGGQRAIEFRKPLLVAMAQKNWSKSSDDADRTVDTVFDEALCDVTELALQTAGVAVSESELFKLRALLIRIARGHSSFEQLAEHVSQYSTAELQQFGLYPARGGSTYRKAAKRLKETDTFEVLREACFIAVHALFRNGVPIPEAVRERYELSYDAGPAAADFSPVTRGLALYNLVEELLQKVVENLSFQRSSNKSRTLRSLVGVFAYAARHGESIENYGQTAQHAFDLTDAFAGSTLRRHIDELRLWRIDEMFDEVNQALLKYVIKSGVVSDPVMISYDLTDVQSLGLNVYDEFFLTADGRWRFASLSFTDPDLEFAFGLRLLKSESQRARVLENFLRTLTSMVDVKLFMADRGFDGREDIEVCREFVPGKWVICAQDDSNPVGQNSDYRRLRAELEPGSTAVRPSAGYGNLNPPVKLLGYSGDNSQADTPDPIRAFYSDMSLPGDPDARESLITLINWQYNQRAKIESMFRMAKNEFDVATDTDKPPRKSFYFHMSVLFYNLYKIVNTVPSPRLGLELDTNQKELLEVLHNLALEGPASPDALAYHREHN
ncbi:hypothetical protein GL213_06700 [Halogeometricum borinquense]|uniref:Transposase n=1 Tax=Halogeometricum borinquense (strain ATCC 700274 / DSM 11551 / JCM 10706 / KCTC 4070 / PR3) TaxID=469382 RepID=E4NSD6_HALBP|nr:hypothetical protein [Halogeometricum borinquense]ADQ66925.1 hypothetical protein Hbor_13430 [Halogeometricum borinquense DSM 11551]ELY30431.1 hypothetical protein C499_04158 [Halogeometricum borinquense DSM 11551]QIQ76235.1 hypothetical protein GL213_06700 [Halogeometricum borinquense]